MMDGKLPEYVYRIENEVRTRMSEKRFAHSLGVAQYAYKMAQDIGAKNLVDFYVAGILHDIAKEIPIEKQLEIMKMKSDIYVFCEDDVLSPTLYHGFCAPYIALRDFSEFVTEEILYGICYHTVGREEMTLFEKVIFLADYIEPTRSYIDCIKIREFYENGIQNHDDVLRLIDECMLKVLDNTLNFLQNKDYFISQRTHNTRNAIFTTLCSE